MSRSGGSFRGEAQSLDRRCPPPTLLGVKSLDESTCSSGYGSQDCRKEIYPVKLAVFSFSKTPDSSVHLSSWQTATSPYTEEPLDDGCYLEDTSSFSTYDNVCDDDQHIYHELELCCRVPERSYSSEQLSSLDDSRASSPIYACPDSPIYAQPWTNYDLVPERRAPNIVLASQRGPTAKPLIVRNQCFRRVLPETPREYATPYAVSPPITYLEQSNSLVYPGSYFSRVVNATKANQTYDEAESRVGKPATMEESEEEFLTELDAQIAELQVKFEIFKIVRLFFLIEMF
ncbi:hypothetical protein TELCIR_13505 [Teladorsagia circumcincta]|uniref:Uncharacterized protein n=1 Tax=Teladorsagia circumcincta TaxID=45464 RepID=A0A2G9U5P2_TELCI|nr:hypothetical protein TELCIR_13505 [Teladorsagia circumcincta]